MDTKLVNVLILGAAFHLIFFSFQTSVFIQQTVVNSIKQKPNNDFAGDGYVSLCITYTVFAISNWLAPSLIALTGMKWGMFLGALTYALYSASFVEPTTASFYAAAGLIGLGAGPLWTGQGGYLAQNSDEQTSGRNAALFWSMLQSSCLFGNIFVYLAFDSKPVISDQTRHLVYSVLAIVCALGALLILLLRNSGGRDQPEAAQAVASSSHPLSGAVSQFVGAFRLAKTPNMILLALAFLFTGQLLSFFTGIYGTAIGATSQFGADSKKFIGLSGVFIGIGEILGGSLFGLVGAQLSKGIKRDTVFVLGYLVTIVAGVIVFLNLPADSSLVEPALMPAIIQPRLWLAMVSSLLIGFGDACFNTQVYAHLMAVYSDHSVGAFALFKFVQSVGSAIAFLYSTTLNLHHQLYLLALVGSIASICFCWAEWRCRRGSLTFIDKSESQQHIASDHQGYHHQIASTDGQQPYGERQQTYKVRKFYQSTSSNDLGSVAANKSGAKIISFTN